MTPNINLRSILEANKLTGPNYIDWLRNLKIVLRSEKLTYVMEKSVPPTLAGNVSTAGHEAYLKHAEDMDVACGIMLASMTPGLQVCLMPRSGDIPSKGRWYSLFHYIIQLFTPKNSFKVSKPVYIIRPCKLISFEYRFQVNIRCHYEWYAACEE